MLSAYSVLSQLPTAVVFPGGVNLPLSLFSSITLGLNSQDFSRINLLFTKGCLMDATGAIIRQIGLESYGNTLRFRKVVLAIAITCCVQSGKPIKTQSNYT